MTTCDVTNLYKIVSYDVKYNVDLEVAFIENFSALYDRRLILYDQSLNLVTILTFRYTRYSIYELHSLVATLVKRSRLCIFVCVILSHSKSDIVQEKLNLL